mmetsp:Transcript_51274/g.81969  ORF Transcript_51274/g.81969 Transcript_51274/m.81969 type:complete len:108 (+) Transcript_51274:26-349(+)
MSHSKSEETTDGQRKLSKTSDTLATKDTGIEGQDVAGEELAQFHAKAKARRKSRQKRVQYQFLFKAGAFLIMLTVVMISKKIQQWYKSEDSGTPSPEADQGKPNGEL